MVGHITMQHGHFFKISFRLVLVEVGNLNVNMLVIHVIAIRFSPFFLITNAIRFSYSNRNSESTKPSF